METVLAVTTGCDWANTFVLFGVTFGSSLLAVAIAKITYYRVVHHKRSKLVVPGCDEGMASG